MRNIFEIIPIQYILIYIFGINVILFLMFFIDKKLAENNRRRISEKSLLISCLIGGSIGGIFGMYICRHKTKKNRFRFGIPIILLIQIVLIIIYLIKLYI